MWLERSGPAHANDAMVLERLAHSVTVTRPGAADGAGQQSLEVLLDATSAAGERDRATARLGLEPRTRLTVVATARSTSLTALQPAALASARMATAYGLVTAVLVRGDLTDDLGLGAGMEAGPADVRAGVGEPVTAERLPESWAGALLALRVTSERDPVVRIGDLGLLAHAVEAADHTATPPADVTGVERAVAHGWSVEALESLADAESVRAVARAAGLHHSTLQARLADLPHHLGFEVTSGRGPGTVARRAHRAAGSGSARFG